MTSSSDYDSVPGSPMGGSPVRRISVEEVVHHHSHLAQLVNSLKSRLKHQLKHMRHEELPRDEEKDIHVMEVAKTGGHHTQDHHTYSNTGANVDPAITLTQVQMKLDGIQNRTFKSRPNTLYVTSPTRVPEIMDSPTRALVRSKSHNYTPLILGQKRMGGSYQQLNVDDVWQYQQQNRYAPVSILMRKTPNTRKNKRVKSLRTRWSILREQASQGSHVSPCDYEIPVKQTFPPFSVPLESAIPPPQLVKANRFLSRQDALHVDTVPRESSYDSLKPQSPTNKSHHLTSLSKSDPCLSSCGDDYDNLEQLSPFSSPTKKTHDQSSPSPTKALLERVRTDPILSPFLLYGKNDSEDYAWDSGETEV